MRSHRLPVLTVSLASVLGLVLTSGCGRRAEERRGEALAERLIERASGGKAKVDIRGDSMKIKTAEGEVEIGAAAKWPADLPAGFPKLESGRYKTGARTAGNGTVSWFMTIEDVTEAEARAYVEALKAAGFKPSMIQESEGMLFFMGEKAPTSVNLNYSGGDRAVSLNVNTKPQS